MSTRSATEVLKSAVDYAGLKPHEAELLDELAMGVDKFFAELATPSSFLARQNVVGSQTAVARPQETAFQLSILSMALFDYLAWALLPNTFGDASDMLGEILHAPDAEQLRKWAADVCQTLMNNAQAKPPLSTETAVELPRLAKPQKNSQKTGFENKWTERAVELSETSKNHTATANLARFTTNIVDTAQTILQYAVSAHMPFIIIWLCLTLICGSSRDRQVQCTKLPFPHFGLSES